MKPLSPEEVLDISELRLAVIALVAEPAHYRLSRADFELLDGLAKQITAANSAENILNPIAAFGTPYSKRRVDLSSGRCSRGWTTE